MAYTHGTLVICGSMWTVAMKHTHTHTHTKWERAHNHMHTATIIFTHRDRERTQPHTNTDVSIFTHTHTPWGHSADCMTLRSKWSSSQLIICQLLGNSAKPNRRRILPRPQSSAVGQVCERTETWGRLELGLERPFTFIPLGRHS